MLSEAQFSEGKILAIALCPKAAQDICKELENLRATPSIIFIQTSDLYKAKLMGYPIMQNPVEGIAILISWGS